METQLLSLETELRETSFRRDHLDTIVAEEKRVLFKKLIQLKNLRTHVDELKEALRRVIGGGEGEEEEEENANDAGEEMEEEDPLTSRNSRTVTRWASGIRTSTSR